MKKLLPILVTYHLSLVTFSAHAADCTGGCRVCERIMCVRTYVSSNSGSGMTGAGGYTNYKYDCNNGAMGTFQTYWSSDSNGTSYSWSCNSGSLSGGNCSDCYTRCVSGSMGVSGYPSPAADCNADTKIAVAADANCPGGYFAVPECTIPASSPQDDAGAFGNICD
jgi:hypothetical protein